MRPAISPNLRDALVDLARGKMPTNGLTIRGLHRRGWMSGDSITPEGLRVVKSHFEGFYINGEGGGGAASNPRYLELMEEFHTWCESRGSSFCYEMIRAIETHMQRQEEEEEAPCTQ